MMTMINILFIPSNVIILLMDLAVSISPSPSPIRSGNTTSDRQS